MNRNNFLDEIDLVDENDQWRQMSEEQREAAINDYVDGVSNADLKLAAGTLEPQKGFTLKKRKGFG